MGAFGRNTRRLKAGLAALLLLILAAVLAPQDAQAQTLTLTATAGDGQVTLSWTTTVSSSVIGPTGYSYNRKAAGGNYLPNNLLVPGNWRGRTSGSYTVTGLDNGTAYTFKMTLATIVPNLVFSNEVTATPTAATTTTAGVTLSRTSLTVEEGGSNTYTVKLDTAPSANVTITVSGASGDVTVDGSPLTFTPSDFSAAQTITVRAADDGDTTDDTATLTHAASSSDTNYGASLEIDDVDVTVTDTTPTFQLLTDPAAVTEGTAISLTVTSDKSIYGNWPVRLTLVARSSSGFDADDIPGTLGPREFNTNFGSANAFGSPVPGKTGTVTIPTSADSATEGAEAYRITLSQRTTYVSYAVGADNTADGTLNDGATATTPAAPTGLTVTPGDRSVVLSWSDPNDASITGWQYRQKAGGGAWGAWTDIGSSGATTTSHTVSGLNNGTAYVFQVRARKGNVNGASSGDSSSVTPRRPEPPGNDGDGGDGPEKSVMMTRQSLRVAESAGNATLTVTASPALGESVTFNVTYAGTATGANNPANGDYDNDAVTSVTFGPLDTSKNIVIPITDDSVDDDDETIIVSIALAPGNTLPDGFRITRASTTVTITDNDNPSVSVPSTLSVAENAGNAVVTITTTRAFGQSMSFDITYGGTATGANNPSNGDYDNDAVTQVTFNAAETTKDITIPITDDGLDEDDETFTVTIAPGQLSEEYERGNFRTTVTIIDDDESPQLDALENRTLKLGQTVDMTANATDGDNDPITYQWTRDASETTPALPGGTALNQARLRFEPPAVGTYTMTVTASDGNGNSDTQEVTITVESAPTVSVPSTLSVAENAGHAVVTVTTESAFGQSVTLNITYGDSSATGHGAPASGDYDNDAVTSVTFGPSETTKDLTIPITDDDLDEDDETFTVTIAASGASPVGYRLGNATTTVTISDDDESPVLEEMADLTVRVGDEVDMTASATDGDNDPITYQWARDASETAPALPGGTALNQARLRFTTTAAGTYTMTVTASDGANSDTQEVVITVTAAEVVSVPSTTVAVTEGTHSSATIAVTTSAAFGGSGLTFNVTYNGGNSDTATGANNPADGDYDNDAVTQVVFSASETTKNIVIPITDDDLDEPVETFTVTIALADGSTLPDGFVLGNATATVTISDDDESPVLEEMADLTVRVGQPVDITASATDGDGDTVTYAWTRDTGEATPPLPQGTALNQARLAFTTPAPGVYTMTVTASDGHGNSDTQEVTITVVVAAASTVSAPSALQVTEGTHRHATVTVTASQAFGSAVTFEVSYRDGTATGANDAADGDYDNDAVTQVVFNASDTTKDIVIPITDDDLDEPAETFTVTIALADGSTLPDGFVLGNATTTVTISDDDESPAMNEIPIVDDDANPGVTVAPVALEIAEGGSEDYTVALDTRPSGEVTVTVGGATDEVTVQPANLSFTPTNWSDPQSVTVASAHDDDAVPDEAVRLTHRASGGGYDGVSIDPVTVTVVEDDEAAVTLSETELALDEGAQGRYTVVLETRPVGGEVTVTPTSADPMALVVSGALRFGASDWNIAQTVTVTGVRDTDTQDAIVRVSHTVSGGDYAGVTAASVTVTVTDRTLAGRPERANRINAEVLPQIAAATMSHTLSAVTERMEESASCEARLGSLRLGAWPSAPFEDEWGLRSHTEPASPSVSELLDGSSFTLPVGASGDTDTASSTLSVWGRGERGSLSGTESAVSWDGELWTAHLGADWCQRSDLVAGAALAYSESDLDAGVGDGAQVAHETKMTSLHPYAVWRLPDGSNLWGSVGYGSGEARISESEDGIHSAALTQDLSQWSVAVGGRRVLMEEVSAVGVGRVALRGEGALARLDTAANDGLSSLAVKTTRLRLLLEASHERALEGDATLTPSLEAGLRRDGGDLGSGLGLEAGASLIWRAPQTGWTGELRARTLVAHERDRDEWGISARLRLDPAADGRGLSLTFGPEYGHTETEMEGLFDYDPVPVAPDSAVEEDREGRVQAELGYGIGISRSGPMALLTPYAGFTVGRSGEETFRVGARYRLGEGFSLGIEGMRQSQAVGENSLMLRAVVRW